MAQVASGQEAAGPQLSGCSRGILGSCIVLGHTPHLPRGQACEPCRTGLKRHCAEPEESFSCPYPRRGGGMGPQLLGVGTGTFAAKGCCGTLLTPFQAWVGVALSQAASCPSRPITQGIVFTHLVAATLGSKKGRRFQKAPGGKPVPIVKDRKQA